MSESDACLAGRFWIVNPRILLAGCLPLRQGAFIQMTSSRKSGYRSSSREAGIRVPIFLSILVGEPSPKKSVKEHYWGTSLREKSFPAACPVLEIFQPALASVSLKRGFFVGLLLACLKNVAHESVLTIRPFSAKCLGVPNVAFLAVSDRHWFFAFCCQSLATCCHRRKQPTNLGCPQILRSKFNF